MGARDARGDVIVFLDAHCEVNHDWLRPILHHIKKNRKAAVTPIIDVLNDETLEYHGGGRVQVTYL